MIDLTLPCRQRSIALLVDYRDCRSRLRAGALRLQTAFRPTARRMLCQSPYAPAIATRARVGSRRPCFNAIPVSDDAACRRLGPLEESLCLAHLQKSWSYFIYRSLPPITFPWFREIAGTVSLDVQTECAASTRARRICNVPGSAFFADGE